MEILFTVARVMIFSLELAKLEKKIIKMINIFFLLNYPDKTKTFFLHLS